LLTPAKAKRNQSGDAGVELTATGDIPAVGHSEQRAVALDILRGIAILLMVFSSVIPFDKPLPSWLFHAQEPTTFDQFHNATHVFDPNHPGLTFVDLVFPLFLFCLGAAIPLALTKKLENGAPRRVLIRDSFFRLLQLSWFAVYIGSIRPANLHDSPSLSTWLIALAGYALMYPMFTRLPKDWAAWKTTAVRAVGYIGGALLLVALSLVRYYPHHLGFKLQRVDVIIVALGDMAFFGTMIWVLTRGQILNRFGFLTVLLAIRLGASEPGWLHTVWTFAPKNTGFFFAFDYLKYLFLVIPGTAAGELVLEWIRSKETIVDRSSWLKSTAYVGLSAALTTGVLVGYESRKLLATALFCVLVCLIANGLLAKPKDSLQLLCHKLTHWGTYWLLIGVLVQPFESGIKKDPSTLSYYFVTAGIAFFLLVSCLILSEGLKLYRPFRLLAACGQNPMIAYVSMANFILPVFALTGLQPILNRIAYHPWPSVFLAGIETILLAIFVGFLSKKTIYWRT
jgi:predicted acyltransferase